ncbi:MAG TPA: MlaD family protein [Marmoricola sp.]|nr:MlaD family protein [Marmoricola sp.]
MKRTTRVRLLIFAIIGGLAVINAGVRYTGLYQMLFPATYNVKVHLASSGGLFPHAEVTWRGVTVGQVTGLAFQTDGVIATLAIGDQYKIPATLTANVHNRSAVGEQYVDLVPSTTAGPLLHDGSVVDASQTTVPIRDEQVVSALDQLERSVNLNDLRTVVSESSSTFNGAGGDIARLITNSLAILRSAQGTLPATQQLLRQGNIVLRTQNADASSISRSIADFNTVFGVLSSRSTDIGTILKTGARAATTLSELARQLQPILPMLLLNTSTLAALTNARLPGIQETLAVLPWALAMAQTPGRDGMAHFTFVGTSSPGPCQKGYIPPAQWLSPLNSTSSTLPDQIGCNEPLSTLPRGANSVHPHRS